MMRNAVALALLQSAAAPVLGPGSGPWQRSAPEAHGLSTPALAAAASLVAALAPQRQCLLVVKDGVIIHETYAKTPGNGRGKEWETDSLGKIFTAGVVGAAVNRKLLSLDSRLIDYGVKPGSVHLWNRSGVDYFPNVTARHLLTQTSGYGLAPPGSLFSYDSDSYIQHLSTLLTAVAKEPSVAFARREFAAPLGVPRLYEFEGSLTDEISAGGGQMASCEDIARMGQLVLNRGRWKSSSSDEFQLLDEGYVRQMAEPANEGVDGYGFLAWLNRDMAGGDLAEGSEAGPPAAHCCGPRWIGSIPPPLGRTACTNATGISDCGVCCVARAGADPLPCDPGLPVLVEGAHTAADRDPSEVISRTIVGDSFPAVDRPPPGVRQNPPDMLMAMGAYAKYLYIVPSLNVSVVSMGLTFGKSTACPGGYDDSFTLSAIWRALAPALIPHAKGTDLMADGSPKVADSNQQLPPVPPVELPALTQLVESGGSCKCYCPPGQGFGRCSAASSKQDCQKLVSTAAAWCPGVGVTHGCILAEDRSIDVCRTPAMVDWAKGHVPGGNCTQTRACELLPGARKLATAACLCKPVNFGSCEWSAEPCPSDSPYFPPLSDRER